MPNRTIGSITVELQAEISKFRTDLARVEKTINQRTKRWEKRFQGVSRAFIGIFSVAAATQITRNLIRTSDQIRNLEARVKSATRETGDFNKVWAQVGNIATSTGTELKTTVEVFQRLSIARKELNVTNTEMLAFTKTVQQLGVIGGASTGNLRAGLTQLSQGLSGTVLRAQEFNSLVENIPAVVQALAKGLKRTQGELRQMVVQGKVLSKDVFSAIQSQAADIAEQYENIPLTIERAVTNLSTAWELWVNEVEKDTGIFNAIAVIINDIATGLTPLKEFSIDALISQINEIQARMAEIKEEGINKGLGDFFSGRNKEYADLADKLEVVRARLREILLQGKETATSGLEPVKIELEKIIVAGTKLDPVKTAFERWAEAIKTTQERADEFNQKLEYLEELFNRGKLSAEDFKEELEKIGVVFEDSKLWHESIEAVAEELDKIGNEGVAAVEAINEEFNTGIDLSKELAVTWDEIMRDTIRGVRNAWVGFFEDVFHGRGIDSIKSFLETVKDMFLRIIAEIAAAWVTSGIFRGLAGLGISIPGGSGSGGISTAIGAAGGVKNFLAGLFGGGGGPTVTALPPAAFIPAGIPLSGALGFPAAGGVAPGVSIGSAGIVPPVGYTGATGATGGAASSGGVGIAGAVPYVMLAIAAIDILTAKNVHWTEQIRNAAAAGANILQDINATVIDGIQNLQTAGLNVEQIGQLSGPGTGQGIVGTSERDKRFAEFAGARGATVLSSDEGSVIRTNRYFSDREAETIEQMIAAFERLEDLMPDLQASATAAFGAMGIGAEEVTELFRDGVLDQVEQAELGFGNLGEITAQQFDVIADAINDGTLSLEALRGEIPLTRAEFDILRNAGVLDIEQLRDASGLLTLNVLEIKEATEIANAGMHSFASESVTGLLEIVSAANSASNAVESIPSAPGGTPGFAHGGQFTVRGQPGTDANLVMFKATAGERVTIDHGAAGGGSSPELLNRMDRLIGLMEAA